MYDPENRLTDAYEPEVGAIPSDDEGRDEENVVKTGTTTVGISTDDGVIIATDRRASLGGRFVSNKSVTKVQQIHPTAAMTLVGSPSRSTHWRRSRATSLGAAPSSRSTPSSPGSIKRAATSIASIRPVASYKTTTPLRAPGPWSRRGQSSATTTPI